MSTWEIDNNNFGGLRIPGVYATPTQGGFQSYASPEDGIAAIGHQLDRYQSGATTGTPLTTLRQMISTWAPPTDSNDTPLLIARAAQWTGLNPDQPVDMTDPSTRQSVISAFAKNESGGTLPDKVTPDVLAKGSAMKGPMDTSVSATPLPGDPNWMLDPDTGMYTNAVTGDVIPAQTGQIPGANLGSDSAPQIDPSAYPAMGDARGAASLMPNLPGGSGTLSADAALPADPMASIRGLLNGQSGAPGFNVSKMLASVAAGMLGGNGGAQSLSKGFAGLAQSQKDDATEQGAMARTLLAFGPQQAEKALEARQSHMAQLVKAGMPASAAAKLVGIPLSDGDAASIDKQMQYGKPLAPGLAKAEQGNLEAIGEQRQFQNQAAKYQQALSAGESGGGFNLDKASVLKYKIDNSGIPLTSPTAASQQYQQFQAFLENARQNLMNSNKGATSDLRSANAMSALTGGGSLGTNEQGITHLNFLGNQSALAEKNLRARISAGRAAGRQPAFDWNTFDPTLTPSTYTGTSADQNAAGLVSGQASPGAAPQQVAPAAPAAGVGTPGVTASGTKYTILPQ